MNTYRIKLIQEKLEKNNIDAMLIANSASLHYLTERPWIWWQRDGGEPYDTSPKGAKTNAILFIPRSGDALIICTPQSKPSFLDTPFETISTYIIAFPYVIERLLYGVKTIAIGAASNTYLREISLECKENIIIQDGEHLVEEMRYYKNASEIEIMREGSAFVDFALEKTLPILKLGVTYTEVEEHLINLGLKYGAQDLAFHPTVRFEKTGTDFGLYYTAHSKDTYYQPHTPLENSSSISFDFGYVRNGYCSDFGRSFYMGKADIEISEAYKVLQKSVCTLYEAIKPYETNMKDMYGIVSKYVYENGYGEHLLNFQGIGMLSHQIGIDVHENPWVHNGSDFVLKPGMIMCIEPKILIPKKCFLRVEDMVLITDNGCESLTKFSRELFEIV